MSNVSPPENNDKNSTNTNNSQSFKLNNVGVHKLNSVITKKRIDVIKWNGWGYNDSRFYIKDDLIAFSGKRYSIGELEIPYFTEWARELFDLDAENRQVLCQIPPPDAFPKANIDQDFLRELKELKVDYSSEGVERLVRSHGQTLHDIYTLRLDLGRLPSSRIPDLVLWPVCHEDVVALVALADRHKVVLLPYGGGTSVSGAASCPPIEPRTICVLDTTQMSGVLWFDKENYLVCCQAGVVGQDLERYLSSKGFTCGHEPDSYEFSTVGGWVATRASGMKKNMYGNIEDLVVSVKLVTAQGVLCQEGLNPRHSTGPDLNHIVLGSEGTLGVITEVVLKIRPSPPCRKYGSIVFPYFDAGVACMREVARQRCQPASIRLMDNEQFRFGQALRPKNKGYWEHLTENLKKAYLQHIKGFDLKHICVATLLFEGDKTIIEEQEKLLYKIAKECGGIPAGEKNGERGYMLTFVIAYIRDLGLEFQIVAESFETSVPWNKTLTLCRNVKYIVRRKCQEYGIKQYLISHRVTQTYDCGSCVYFYFAFNWRTLTDPVATYEDIEAAAREEILRCGGSLSHHHGVGKLRSRWYPSQVSPLGAALYAQTKHFLDPNNIFAAGNILPDLKPKL